MPSTALDDVVIPDSPAALEEMLSDPKTMAKVLTNKEALPEFVTKYAQVVLNKHQEIGQQVEEQVQRVLATWLKENDEKGIVPRVNMGAQDPIAKARMADARKGGLYNPSAMGAPLDGEFETSAEYFQSIWHKNTDQTAALQGKLGRVRAAFTSGVPAEGGFLIPETMRSELLRVGLETAVVRPRARVIPMESLRVPFPAIDATSNASNVYGGIVAYWTEEGAAMVESSASFSRVVLDAKKLTCYTEVPNELISDSAISFEMFINEIFPEAMAYYEDAAFLAGTGVGEPKGVFNSGALVSIDAEGSQPAATIVWENIVKMYARMLPSSLNRAVWLVSPDTFPELATMALAVGTGGSAVWLANGVGAPTMTILGRPVIVTEKAEVLGTAGDISFVDLGMYLIGDRQVMSATSSPHFKFSSDKTAYRIISRVDGRPWLESAITPKNGGPALSPFVNLETRS